VGSIFGQSFLRKKIIDHLIILTVITMADFDSKDDGGASKEPDFSSWMPAGCEPLADGEYDAIVMGT